MTGRSLWRRGCPEASGTFAPPLSECFQSHILREGSTLLCSVQEEWPTWVSLPPEWAEWDGPPHSAHNAPALCSDKGAPPV